MGISTVQSYCGAQIFEAIGLNHELIDRYFTGTPSRIEGIGIREIGEETLRRHRVVYEPVPIRQLDFGGGEIHHRSRANTTTGIRTPSTKLQHATRNNDPKTFAEFSQLVNDESKRRSNLRGLWSSFAGTGLRWKKSSWPKTSSNVSPLDVVRLHQQGSARDPGHRYERLGAKSNTVKEVRIRSDSSRSRTATPQQLYQTGGIREVLGVTSHYL